MGTRSKKGPTSPQGHGNMYGTDNEPEKTTALVRNGTPPSREDMLALFEPTMSAPVPAGAVEHEFVPSVTVPEHGSITGILGQELREEVTDEDTGVVSSFPTWEIRTPALTVRIRGGFELARLIRRCKVGNRVTVQRGSDYPSPKNPKRRCASFRVFEG